MSIIFAHPIMGRPAREYQEILLARGPGSGCRCRTVRRFGRNSSRVHVKRRPAGELAWPMADGVEVPQLNENSALQGLTPDTATIERKGEFPTLANPLDADEESPVSLQYQDLRGRDLRKAQFQNANLQFADLRDCDLRHAQFRGANLEGARLCGANLEGADMRRANLQSVDFSGATFSTRHNSYLLNIAKYALGDRPAFFECLDAVDLEGSNLRGALFDPVFLVGRVAVGAHMREIFLWCSDAGGPLFHMGHKLFSPPILRGLITAQCVGAQKSAMLAALDFLESQIPNLSRQTAGGSLNSTARLTEAAAKRILMLLDERDVRRGRRVQS